MAVVLGIDLGEKRVGLAISDGEEKLALPLDTIAYQSRKKLLEDLTRFIQDYAVGKIVVGLPKSLSGELGPAANKIVETFNWLQKQIPNQWMLWDERLTTKEVDRLLIEADVRRNKRREIRDQLAAQRILQNYLDYHRSVR